MPNVNSKNSRYGVFKNGPSKICERQAFKFFSKVCLPQTLPGPLLNTLSHMTLSQLFLNQESDLLSIENMEVLRAGSGKKYYRTLFLTTAFTAKNAVISPNSLV